MQKLSSTEINGTYSEVLKSDCREASGKIFLKFSPRENPSGGGRPQSDMTAGQLELASPESYLSELINQRLSYSAAPADHSPSEC